MNHEIRDRLQQLSLDMRRVGPVESHVAELVSIVQALAVDLYPAKLPPVSEADFDTVSRIGPGGGTMKVNKFQTHNRMGDPIATMAPLQVDMSHLSPEAQVDARFAQSTGATGIRYTSEGPRFDVAMTSGQATRYAAALGDADVDVDQLIFDDRRKHVVLFDGFDWTARDQFDAKRMGWELRAHDDGLIMVYSAGEGEDNDVGEAVRKLAEGGGASQIVLALRPGAITLGGMKPADAIRLCQRAGIIYQISARVTIGDRAMAAFRKAGEDGRTDLQNTLAPIVDEVV